MYDFVHKGGKSDAARYALEAADAHSGEINGTYHDASLKMGLADSAMQILYSVHMAVGELYPSEIARLCGMSRQTVSSALRALEKQGFCTWRRVRGEAGPCA